MGLGGIFKRTKTRKGKLTTLDEKDINPKVSRYFEREVYLPNKITREQLEKRINEILFSIDGYGNVVVSVEGEWEDMPTLRVYMEKIDTEFIYFCRVCISRQLESVEQIIEELRKEEYFSDKAILMDVVRYSNFKILIFKE